MKTELKRRILKNPYKQIAFRREYLMEFEDAETDSLKVIHVHVPLVPGPLAYLTQTPWAHSELSIIPSAPSTTASFSL